MTKLCWWGGALHSVITLEPIKQFIFASVQLFLQTGWSVNVCVFIFDILRSGLTTGGETPPSHSTVVLTGAELRVSGRGSCETQWGLRSFSHVCVENASEVCCTLSADWFCWWLSVHVTVRLTENMLNVFDVFVYAAILASRPAARLGRDRRSQLFHRRSDHHKRSLYWGQKEHHDLHLLHLYPCRKVNRFFFFLHALTISFKWCCAAAAAARLKVLLNVRWMFGRFLLTTVVSCAELVLQWVMTQQWL